MACQYGEFKHDPKFGFTGSAGKTPVKAHLRSGGKVQMYARGGAVKKHSGCACGGKVGMKKGGKTKMPRLSKSEKALVKQILDQTAATGRMPGLPGKGGVPVASREPLINS